MTSLTELWQRMGGLAQRGVPEIMVRAAENAATRAQKIARQLVVRRKQVRSGELRDSIRAKVNLGNGLTIQLIAQVPYGKIQEEGGQVRGSPYLKIPLSGASGEGNLFSIRLKDGRLFLVRRQGSGIAFVYRLHPGPIKIKGGHFLRDAMDQVRPELKAELERSVLAALEGRDAQ